MPRTKGKKNITPRKLLTNSPHTPDIIYKNLSPLDKLIVYYYWIYSKTEGKQGWDPDRSGFREHWSTFLVIRSHYSASGFYTRGKVSNSMALASF